MLPDRKVLASISGAWLLGGLALWLGDLPFPFVPLIATGGNVLGAFRRNALSELRYERSREGTETADRWLRVPE